MHTEFCCENIEKQPLQRLRRWEDNIRMDLREVVLKYGVLMEVTRSCVH